MTFQTIIPKVGQEFKGIQEYWSMVENCTSLSVGPLIDFQLTAYYICTVFFEFPHTKNTINTVPYVHICASSTPVWWFVWRFCYVKNVLRTVSNAFNVYQAFNFREIKNLFMDSARFCENLFYSASTPVYL